MEVTTFTLIGGSFSSGTKYKLIFEDVSGATKFTTDEIAVGCSSSDFKNEIKKFYSKAHGANIDVSRTMLLANGTTTSSLASADKVKYTIKLVKQIIGKSVGVI